jgi:hypothetical protein
MERMISATMTIVGGPSKIAGRTMLAAQGYHSNCLKMPLDHDRYCQLSPVSEYIVSHPCRTRIACSSRLKKFEAFSQRGINGSATFLHSPTDMLQGGSATVVGGF